MAATLQKCVFRNGSLLKLKRLSTSNYISLSSLCLRNQNEQLANTRTVWINRKYLHPSTTYQFYFCTHQLSTDQKQPSTEEGNKSTEITKKLSLYQRFKQMYRDYWYVLVPVHLVTSTIWFGSFYYMAKSGVDIVGIMESMGASEKWINHLKESSMGYVAISYALYKIATPLRYAVTLGGTTITINYLQKWGYIKPVPSTEKLKVMFTERKDNILGTMREKQKELIVKADQLKGKTMNAVKEKTQEDGHKIIVPSVKKK